MKVFLLSLNLLGGLGVFLYGMRVLSESLQKAAGDRLRKILSAATNNRIRGVFSGFLVTCVVQSSSATTVMIVSFCSAGLLSLRQSLGMIFGANIGTTTTGWIVSLLGFKVKVSSFALPMIGIGFFSQFVRKWRWPHRAGEVLVGFGLLFLGLFLIKEAIPNVHESAFVMDWIAKFSAPTMSSTLMAVLIGTCFTMIFQSSSAMMAVTLAAAATGIVDYRTSAALVLGENIGTTLTANLASIGAPITARQAARGHFFFNIFGVIWILLVFDPFLRLVDFMVPGNPWGTSENALLVAIPTHIAAFHSVFNITNTLIVLPFLEKMEKFILWLLPEEKVREDHELIYLSTPLSSTPELALNAAEQEVGRMADIVLHMLRKVATTLDGKSKNRVGDVESILKDEKTTDILEHKINEYLSALTHAHLSTASTKKVISLLNMINDLERMGDHGEKLAKLLRRSDEGNHKFSPEGIDDLRKMAEKTIEIVERMKASMAGTDIDPMPGAREREAQLNQLRDHFKDLHIGRITNGTCHPFAGIIFSDMLTSFEKMGDHAFNVVEASVGIK